jgi:multicomponent Na+:H+ antiporter subunit D
MNLLPVGILPPLPVTVPLAVAGLLLAFHRMLPPRLPDVVAILVALAAAGCCAWMCAAAAQAPLVYWFGGWTPRPGLVLGIGFSVDQAGAAVAGFIGLLFAAAMLFSWGYFDEVHAHFHVLMLLFMAGMIGFCLTHDLFNMFVWFEVMSVAGFALTGYRLHPSALSGALNFTVLNTIGAYLLLSGIGLLYIRIGALDFGALARGVAQGGDEPVVLAGFALLAAGLLVKAAQVPFQFWLADAHAVAPSPVSVIFSGAMVSIGLFGVLRLLWPVFAASHTVHDAAGTLLLGMGAGSAVVGGAMALIQRHIKRLLAFSTISHVGIMLTGLALLDRQGLAGMLTYLVGHGLVKAALFMVAGILLASCGGIDEIGLRGLGRRVWPAGVAMGFGGLLLAGLPVGLMHRGEGLIDAVAPDWVTACAMFGAACTGGAVLRVTGRVFAGLGAVAGEEERAPSEAEREKANRPLWLMLAPCALLLVLSLPGADAAARLAAGAAAQVMGGAPPGPTAPEPSWPSWVSLALALALAAVDLFRAQLGLLASGSRRLSAPFTAALQAVHSGIVGDYVAWLVVGLALFALALS